MSLLDNPDLFAALKLIHIASLIFWLGPSLGAWWILRTTTYRFGEPSLTSQFLYQTFLKVTGLEHIALSLLLISGAAMAMLAYGFDQGWLVAKLLLVGSIIIPIELVDIWFCHHKLPAMFHQRHPSRPYSASETSMLSLYHRRFIPLALVVMPVTVLSIFWLVISKPMV